MGKTIDFKAALLPMTCTSDTDHNRDQLIRGLDAAQAMGAAFILTPENTNMLHECGQMQASAAMHEADDPLIGHAKHEAKTRKIWLLIGSAILRDDTANPDKRLVNRSLLIDDKGEIAARYDKIHLFDATVADGMGTYSESSRIRPGGQPVIAQTPWGKLGMGICYDMRFGYLFRHYAELGADFIALPAAFTVPTGQKHWHVLLRARAIETGCYVFAPAQYGAHGDKRASFGHSLIVAPDGTVLADSADSPHPIAATITPAAVDQARNQLGILHNARPTVIT